MAITYQKMLRSVQGRTLGGSTATAQDTTTESYATNAYSESQAKKTMKLVVPNEGTTLVPFHAVETVISDTEVVEQTKEDPYCEEGGGGDVTVEALSVTENGTYTAPTGKAYSPVMVNVSGGGGDFSTATVTVTNNKSSAQPIQGAFVMTYDGDTIIYESEYMSALESREFTVVVPSAIDSNANTLEFTGDGGYEEDWEAYVIRGNCTVAIKQDVS